MYRLVYKVWINLCDYKFMLVLNFTSVIFYTRDSINRL